MSRRANPSLLCLPLNSSALVEHENSAINYSRIKVFLITILRKLFSIKTRSPVCRKNILSLLLLITFPKSLQISVLFHFCVQKCRFRDKFDHNFFLKTKSKNPLITFFESSNDKSNKASNFSQYRLG